MNNLIRKKNNNKADTKQVSAGAEAKAEAAEVAKAKAAGIANKIKAIDIDEQVDQITDEVHKRWDEVCDYLENKYKDNERAQWIIEIFLRRLSIESPIIVGFCFVCCVLHLLNITIMPGISNWLGINSVGFNPVSPLDNARLFTHMFGHDGLVHLRNNMTHLLLVGPFAESSFGSTVIVQVMIVCGIATSLAHMVIGKRNSRQIGASGFIFALILLNSLASAKRGKIPVSFVLTAMLWLVDEVVGLFFNFTDNTSHHGHLVGGIVGAVAGFYLSEQNNTSASPKPSEKQQQTKKKES